jgi:hypothetical protein
MVFMASALFGPYFDHDISALAQKVSILCGLILRNPESSVRGHEHVTVEGVVLEMRRLFHGRRSLRQMWLRITWLHSKNATLGMLRLQSFKLDMVRGL